MKRKVLPKFVSFVCEHGWKVYFFFVFFSVVFYSVEWTLHLTCKQDAWGVLKSWHSTPLSDKQVGLGMHDVPMILEALSDKVTGC